MWIKRDISGHQDVSIRIKDRLGRPLHMVAAVGLLSPTNRGLPTSIQHWTKERNNEVRARRQHGRPDTKQRWSTITRGSVIYDL